MVRGKGRRVQWKEHYQWSHGHEDNKEASAQFLHDDYALKTPAMRLVLDLRTTHVVFNLARFVATLIGEPILCVHNDY